MKALPNGAQSFAHTQALWRFLDNERTTPAVLIEPVLANACAALEQVSEQLTYTHERDVEHPGRTVTQWIGATTVTRPAKPKRLSNGQRVPPIPGAPLAVRLIVSRIADAQGQVIAMWYLLSNVSMTVSADQLALWYYWRWRIESYFKLLKGAGQHLESWQQETGLAILKRSLIASHACALTWALQRLREPQAQATATFLVRLAGRQMKRSQPITAPALLAGLYQLFAMLEVLEHHSVDQLKSYAQTAFPPYARAWI